MHLLNLSHCLVGLDSAFRAFSLNCFNFSSLVFILLEMSSAVFSALLFVFTKTNACFSSFMVSKAKSRAPFPVSEEIFLVGINQRDNQKFYKVVGLLNNLNLPGLCCAFLSI